MPARPLDGHRAAPPTRTRRRTGADVIVVLTEWPEFGKIDLDRLAAVDARARPIVDTRNVLDPTAVRVARASTYDGVGTPLMAHVLLAGGAGFIGSHLARPAARARRHRGVRRRPVDRVALSTPRPTPRTIGTGSSSRDISLPGLAEAIGDDRFDVVMNLASPASPPAYLARPIATLDAGSIGTQALLEIARRDGARFFLASTSEVYGDPLEHPQVETYWGNVNPVGERSVYDEAKRFAEALTTAYARVHGLEVRIARIFNTYGPRMQLDDGRVVTNFVHQALTRRAAHALRRRHADPQLLLRRRRGHGPAGAARQRPSTRPGQHRQPERGHDARAGDARARADRLGVARRAPCRCPSTTRVCAGPTSRSPVTCWGGSRSIDLRDRPDAHDRRITARRSTA